MRSKLLRFALLASGLFFFGFLRLAHAGQLESDLRTKTIQLHYTQLVAVNTSTNIVLISVSSTTYWPNPTAETGYININNLYIQVDKVAASTSTVKVGVVTYVDTSTGSVKYFAVLSSSKSVSNNLNNYFYESDNSFRCLKVISATPNSGFDGTTPFLISNDIVSGSTLFQSDVVLPAVDVTNGGMFSPSSGNIAPGLGDIVASIFNPDVTNNIVVTIDMEYHYNSR